MYSLQILNYNDHTEISLYCTVLYCFMCQTFIVLRNMRSWNSNRYIEITCQLDLKNDAERVFFSIHYVTALTKT